MVQAQDLSLCAGPWAVDLGNLFAWLLYTASRTCVRVGVGAMGLDLGGLVAHRVYVGYRGLKVHMGHRVYVVYVDLVMP